MRFSPIDEDVEIYKTVFQEDLLGRNKFSVRLSRLLENIEDPLVLALNGRWGTGKSYFLKRWVGAHNAQNKGGALTVYFDAFAHDYLSDPLPALIGTLSARAPREDKQKLARVKSAAIKLLKPTARVGFALATFGATEVLNDLGDAAAEAIGGEASNAVDEFWKKEEGRQAAMEDFRAALTSLTKEGDVTRPVIIVVDELDRCRPDYALEVLETIKHFFSVSHVHFVLGVNLTALENSVKVRYGAEVDAAAYLQKFLSFTMTLPDHIGDHNKTPSIIKYVNHLGGVLGTPDHFVKSISEQLRHISKNNYISIRDVGKIMSSISIIPEYFKDPKVYFGWRIIFSTLVITKTVRPDLFDKLVKASATEEELIGYFGVSDNVQQELNDGERNPRYDHELFLMFAAWKFVISDGHDIIADNADSFRRIFSQFGDMHDVRGIPSKVNDEWLSDFSVP